MLPRTKKRRFGIIEGLEDRQLMAADLVGGIIEPVDSMPKNTGDEPPVFIQAGEKMSDFEAVPNLGQHQWAIPSNLAGVWTNANDNTRGVTKIQVFDGPGGPQIQAWGSCLPEDCDWGRTDLDLLGTSVTDVTPDYALGSWDPGFKETTVTMNLNGFLGKIVDIYHVYSDDSARENRHERLWLSNHGTMYEIDDLGNDELQDVIAGSWVSSNANTGGVTRAEITVPSRPGASGDLDLNLFGACSPTDCDWGSTSMHEVGSSIVDTTPEYAIANQEFGFKSVFVTSRYESGDLIVGTYNVFHDDSGRSNYFSEERMWKMGDANHDGHFNSSDIVQIMQAGEYEDGINNNSTWEEGDFDRDGDFTTSDLVLAFSSGGFGQTRVRPFLPPVLIPIPDLDPEVRFNLSADLIDDIFDEDDFEVPQLPPGIEIGPGIRDHIFAEGIVS